MANYDTIYAKAYAQERKKELARREKAKIEAIKLKAKEMARSRYGKAGYYAGSFVKTMGRGIQRTAQGIEKFEKADRKHRKKKNQAMGRIQNMTEAFFR